MSNENREQIRYKVNLNLHLLELNCFVLKRLSDSDLLPVEKTKSILEQSQHLNQMTPFKFTIPFEEKGSERFKKYIEQLQTTNSSGVYIWIERTNDCGTSVINSLLDINWGFDFSCSKNGILVFETLDLQDRILFDFFEEDGEHYLEIEVRGTHWPKIAWGKAL